MSCEDIRMISRFFVFHLLRSIRKTLIRELNYRQNPENHKSGFLNLWRPR